MKKKAPFQIQGAEVFTITRELRHNDDAALSELKKTMEKILKVSPGNTAEQRAGWIAEEFHAGTFNASARSHGDFDTTALTGSTGGFNNDVRVDIKVVKGAKVIGEYQSKYNRNAPRTAAEISKPQYEGTSRLVPSDQAKDVKKILDTKVQERAGSPNEKVQLKRVHRQEASGKVTDQVKAEGHQSKPLSSKEATKLASGDMSSLDRMMLANQLGAAAKSGAISGAAFGGGISAIKNIHQLATGQTTVKEAATEVALETVTSSVRTATTAVMAEGLKITAKRTLSAGVAQRIAGGSGPLAIAGCVVEVATDAYKGELTPEKAAKSVGRAASGWAGAEVGMIAGAAFGPPGVLIGGLMGGLAATLSFSAFF